MKSVTRSGLDSCVSADVGHSCVSWGSDAAEKDLPLLPALPEALLSETLGYLAVDALGRTSCSCRSFRDACSDERLWVALWKGPLPRGFGEGEKAAHAAVWLLAKGLIKQTRVADYAPRAIAPGSSGGTDTASGHVHENSRTRRWRVDDPAFGSPTTPNTATAWHSAGGMGGGVTMFPVHVSCIATNGDMIATAAGPEVTVWAFQESAPRARFNVGGHGSVTCLLLRHECLLAGDNSGYLRCYALDSSGSHPLMEVRAHTDRVTAIDAFTNPAATSSAGEKAGSQRGSHRCSVANGRGAHAGSCSRAEAGLPWDSRYGGVDDPVVDGEAEDKKRAVTEAGSPGSGLPSLETIRSPRAGGALHDAAEVACGRLSRHGHGRGQGVAVLDGARVRDLVQDLLYHDDLRSRGDMQADNGEPASLGERQGYAWSSRGEIPRQVSEREGVEWAWGASARGGTACVVQGAGDDQPILLTGSDDGTAKAWDAASERLLNTYAGHTRGITCLQATLSQSYGPVLVTGGGDGAVIVWELATGRCLERLETGAGLGINHGVLGPRIGCLQAYGDTIVVGEDRFLCIWSLSREKSPELLSRGFFEHPRPIRGLAVVGRCIVTCAGDHVLRLWDSSTGLSIREIGIKSGAAITSFCLSGLCLLTTSLFDASVLRTSFRPPS